MSSQPFRDLILFHRDSYPLSEPRDFYKLIYQGVFGVGHIISEKAKDYLVEEANRVNLKDYLDRELVEPVAPDGKMVRIYLRPFMRAHLSLDQLFNVMIKSAKMQGDQELFKTYWGSFLEMVDSGDLSFDPVKMKALKENMERHGIKPRHHTEPYRDAYYPAYRVVWKQYFVEEFGEL